ncbi:MULTISPECIES: hypothetical protein [Microvirga]|uniref:hypothetical protein n=1 Tax=Microvirga TaxID=186650 RepID=UPI0021C9C697|nr:MULTISPECIES: hypothetical protein [unclassified Microvirga]
MVNDGLGGFVGGSDRPAIANEVELHPLPGRSHGTGMKLPALNPGDLPEIIGREVKAAQSADHEHAVAGAGIYEPAVGIWPADPVKENVDHGLCCVKGCCGMESFNSGGEITSRVKQIEHCGCCLIIGLCYVSAGLADAVLGFTQDLCSRCQVRSRSVLERISYPLSPTVQADTWDMVVSQMKKTSPSFTFEVKRSKLSAHKPSTFERFVLEPKQKLFPPARPPANQERSAASKTETSVVERRILESLPIAPAVPELELPSEQQVEETVQVEVKAQAPSRRRKAVASPVASSVEVEEAHETPLVKVSLAPRTSAVVVPLPISKGKRKAVASVDHLPRGERWKRRLPRAAW